MKGFCVVLEIQRRGNLVAAWEGEMGVAKGVREKKNKIKKK